MRWRILAAMILAATAAVSCVLTLSCAQKQPETAAAAKPDPVVRGRYLVTIMSCNDCHTPGYFYGAPDTTRRLAGSDLGWVGPWGVVHARNLTPDSTGIGSWTVDDIVTALRTGHTPSGAQLAPIMPWANYSEILDQDDALAIAAYLKSLPPVSHKNLARIPPNQKPIGALMKFPPPPAWDVPPGAPSGAAK